jgi:hypothetical protein
VKVYLSLCLNAYHVMKKYGGVTALLREVLNSVLALSDKIQATSHLSRGIELKVHVK